MDTKGQFFAYLEANSISYEGVNDKILFEFENHYLAASGFWKKGFRIEIPFAITPNETLTNTDKEMIMSYIKGKNDNGVVSFQGSVMFNPDGIFNPDEFISVSNELSNKKVNIDELRQTSVELVSAFCEAFVGLGKVALSASTALLSGIAKAIDPYDNKTKDDFGEDNEN